MKKIFFITSLFIIFCFGFADAGQKVVAVQSFRIKPYEEALKGFKSIGHHRIQRLVVSELGNLDIIKKLHEIRPNLILAIGMDALSLVKPIKDIPIIYLMTLNPQSMLSGEKNITGVSMDIPLEKQLMALLDAVPNTKTIGLLYDPDRTGHLVKGAFDFANLFGVNLMAREVHNPKYVPALLMEMKGKIDVFWMLPDTTVVTPETVEFMLLFAIENNIPILTFSEKYVEMGAFMSIDIDAFDMGCQAGEMAKSLLQGKDIANFKQAHARRAIVSTNLIAARNIGIRFAVALDSDSVHNKKILRTTRIIN